MNNNLTKHLSEEQLKPLTRKTPNASIFASAGSGKTKTLVHLLAFDLANDIPPSSIVAFTFTEKAATELMARIHNITTQHLSSLNLTGIYIGTIHAWCLQYLVNESNYYNFAPVDELQIDALVSRLYDYLQLEQVYGVPYPKAVDSFISDLEIFYNEHLSINDIPKSIKSSIELFINILYQSRMITYGGMIRHATLNLNENGPKCNIYRIYVDEYQDVNPAQVELIKSMSSKDTKIVVVGDDLQCIYNWRGSDVTRILEFPNEFKDVSVFRLSTNYRSKYPIVDLANKIAEKVILRDKQKIMTSFDKSINNKYVNWLSVESEEAQADIVSDIVAKLHKKGVPYNSIAVLLRSVNNSGQPYVDSFNRNNIPVYCPLLSRGGEFINQLLIPIFDWLRKEHREPKNQHEEQEFENVADNLWDKAKKWVKTSNAETVFWVELNKWLDIIDDQKSHAYDVRGRLYDFMNICEIKIEFDDNNLMVGVGIASQIIRSVEEIHRHRITGQQRRTPRGVMTEIYFALQRNQHDFGESLPIEHMIEGVLVSTVHQAKGLEWPVVIVPTLVKNRFPLRPSNHGTSYPDNIAERYGTTIDDERRLFYVAITRAKERLFMIDPKLEEDGKRSLFLKELLEDKYLEPIRNLSIVPSEAWDVDLSTIVNSDPVPVRIGLSDLLIYLECPYQFGLRRIVAIQPSIGEELGFGKSIHELIQRRFDEGTPWEDQKLKSSIDEHVHLPYMSEQGESQSKSVIAKRMSVMERLGLFDTQVESEIPIEVRLTNGIVHGIIDNVLIENKGTYRVRDWKSNIHDELIQRYERQLRFYAYALTLMGYNVSGADIVDIAQTTKQNRLVSIDIDLTHSVLLNLISDMETSINNIGKGLFPATPSKGSCSSCDMSRICSVRC